MAFLDAETMSCCESRPPQTDNLVVDSIPTHLTAETPEVKVEMQAPIDAMPGKTPNTGPANGTFKPRAFVVWLGQLVASVSWIVSVLTYEAEAGETWSDGDRLQMTAACAWTVSNVCAFPDIFEGGDSFVFGS